MKHIPEDVVRAANGKLYILRHFRKVYFEEIFGEDFLYHIILANFTTQNIIVDYVSPKSNFILENITYNIRMSKLRNFVLRKVEHNRKNKEMLKHCFLHWALKPRGPLYKRARLDFYSSS